MRGWVMAKAPLVTGEQVRHGPDDQGRHPGRQAAVSDWQFFWRRQPLTVRLLLPGGCPLVGDPIDALAHLRESLHFGVWARASLPCVRAAFASITSCLRMALASHSLTRSPINWGQ